MARRPDIVVQIDDLLRRYSVFDDFGLEKTFMQYINVVNDSLNDQTDLDTQLEKYKAENTRLQNKYLSEQKKLQNAKTLLDTERNIRCMLEKKNNDLNYQISMVREMLNEGRINETREKLQTLSSGSSLFGEQRKSGSQLYPQANILSPNPPLGAITEEDTYGSILNISEIELTNTEDLNCSKTRSGRRYITNNSMSLSSSNTSKRKASSPAKATNKSKRSRDMYDFEQDKENIASSNKNQASAYNNCLAPSAPPMEVPPLSVEGQTLSSFFSTIRTPAKHKKPSQPFTPIIENVYSSPSKGNTMVRVGSAGKIQERLHFFVTKTCVVSADTCSVCEKKIRFGKSSYKCQNCRTSCHPDCKEKVPLPCVPSTNNGTPGSKAPGFLADYAPTTPPMIPALVIHCVREVEDRGLSEVGIYRVPGSAREVKMLKDRFLRNKGVPNILSKVDIHVVCGTLTSFLRSLKEPLIPCSQWEDFIRSTEKSEQDAMAILYQAISDLPQPNRETLAYLILHLQKVAECPECKMPTTNLAKIFGPTIVGNSAADPEMGSLILEARLTSNVMELLLSISSDYWNVI